MTLLRTTLSFALLASARSNISDDFSTYNLSAWDYADNSMGVTCGSKTWYLRNHSAVNTTLSLGAGRGLRMLMSSTPCRTTPSTCGGAKMAADHLTGKTATLYGEYRLVMRAPYTLDGGAAPPTCSPGVYAYFTAGYASKGGKWNEVNFGFHPDRDMNGTAVSCEHHDDTGGYHETVANLGFSYRNSFNTFVVRAAEGSLSWLVGHGVDGPLKAVHSANATLTEPMTTRLIFRTNFRDGDPGYLPDHAFEIAHFSFTPAPPLALS